MVRGQGTLGTHINLTIFKQPIQLRTVSPGRAKREPGIHNHDREYGSGPAPSGASPMCTCTSGNDDVSFADTTSSSRREAPEALMNLPPKEGVGNAGCPLHPRPRVHLVVVERTRVTTSTPESPDVPARNGFTAYVELSPVTGLVCHRRSADMFLSKPGRADATPQT